MLGKTTTLQAKAKDNLVMDMTFSLGQSDSSTSCIVKKGSQKALLSIERFDKTMPNQGKTDVEYLNENLETAQKQFEERIISIKKGDDKESKAKEHRDLITIVEDKEGTDATNKNVRQQGQGEKVFYNEEKVESITGSQLHTVIEGEKKKEQWEKGEKGERWEMSERRKKGATGQHIWAPQQQAEEDREKKIWEREENKPGKGENGKGTEVHWQYAHNLTASQAYSGVLGRNRAHSWAGTQCTPRSSSPPAAEDVVPKNTHDMGRIPFSIINFPRAQLLNNIHATGAGARATTAPEGRVKRDIKRWEMKGKKKAEEARRDKERQSRKTSNTAFGGDEIDEKNKERERERGKGLSVSMNTAPLVALNDLLPKEFAWASSNIWVVEALTRWSIIEEKVGECVLPFPVRLILDMALSEWTGGHVPKEWIEEKVAILQTPTHKVAARLVLMVISALLLYSPPPPQTKACLITSLLLRPLSLR